MQICSCIAHCTKLFIKPLESYVQQGALLFLLFVSFIFLSSSPAQANLPAGNTDLFIITVDATIADDTPAGQFKVPSSNINYQLYWEEVGNEAGNNSGGRCM